MLTEEHIARAEIIRIAEPEDPFVNVCIDMLGVVQTAHFMTGRETLTPDFWRSQDASDMRYKISDEELHKLHHGLLDRISRWSARGSRLTTEQEFKMAESLSSWLCIPEDDDWPDQLSDLGERKPYGLWGRGKREYLSLLRSDRSIAVVGSRDISAYGTSATSHITGDLAQQGFSIISGGAFGIDAVAHRTALAVVGSSRPPTVALMACGVDRPYPKHHESLLREIIDRGLLLSEVSLGSSPTRWRFLQRNRLIAALSSYTLVVEARWRSGALNTAHHALSIGRELGVIPGQIFSPNSEGCHRLLKKELAHLVTDAQDIIDTLTHRFSSVEPTLEIPVPENAQKIEDLSELQRRVWDSLPLRRPTSLEHIATMSGLTERSTMLILSQLASEGVATSWEGLWAKAE